MGLDAEAAATAFPTVEHGLATGPGPTARAFWSNDFGPEELPEELEAPAVAPDDTRGIDIFALTRANPEELFFGTKGPNELSKAD